MESSYVKSVYKIDDLPQDRLVEVAIAGKSNVGKSSLINKLTGRRQLAKTSGTPGKTQCLNYFRIEPGAAGAFYLVDLPGYGYAKVSKSMRRDWGALIETYLNKSKQLVGLVALFDARRDPTAEDQDWLAWLGQWEKPSLVVLTKSDKLTRSEQAQSLRRWAPAVASGQESPLLFSSNTGDGKDHLWQWIDDLRRARTRAPLKK